MESIKGIYLKQFAYVLSIANDIIEYDACKDVLEHARRFSEIELVDHDFYMIKGLGDVMIWLPINDNGYLFGDMIIGLEDHEENTENAADFINLLFNLPESRLRTYFFVNHKHNSLEEGIPSRKYEKFEFVQRNKKFKNELSLDGRICFRTNRDNLNDVKNDLFEIMSEYDDIDIIASSCDLINYETGEVIESESVGY